MFFCDVGIDLPLSSRRIDGHERPFVNYRVYQMLNYTIEAQWRCIDYGYVSILGNRKLNLTKN